MVGLLLALVGPLQDASSADVERKLSAMRISIEFSGAPLGEAVDFVREASGLNIVVDPRVDKRAGVTMQVKGVTLKSALNLILKPLEATRKEKINIPCDRAGTSKAGGDSLSSQAIRVVKVTCARVLY